MYILQRYNTISSAVIWNFVAEMATRLVQVGLAEAIKRGAIKEA
jgi:hypothetical protein